MGKPIGWRAEEKGIDVMMALDIALGARDDLYDVADASGTMPLTDIDSRRCGTTPTTPSPLSGVAGSDWRYARPGLTVSAPYDLHSLTKPGKLCPLFPAVHHRSAEVHWRGFIFLC